MSSVDLDIEGLSDFEEIGSGGFSTVYHAHERGFGRRVAIKVIHAIDDNGRRRFERELNLMGQLDDHPHVVTPYRYGYTSTGAPYLVMEYLGGGTLEQVIDVNRPVRPDIAVAYILPVAQALERAHQVGILHRDIKPGNILLTADGVSKLTDFGISSIKEATATQQAYTLAHSPPETFADVDLRDERSDLYSLASTFFTLVVGRTPFASLDGSDAYQGYIARILANQVPPTGYDAVDRFLAVAMAKDPANRYPTATEFADALRRVGHATHDLDRPARPAQPILQPEPVSPTPAATPGPGTYSFEPTPSFDSSPSSPHEQQSPLPSGAGSGERSRRSRRVLFVVLALGVLVALAAAGALLGSRWFDGGQSTSAEGPLVFTGHTASIRELIVLGDGRVASASSDGAILVWEPDRIGADPITLTGGSGRSGELAELGDGRIVSAGPDGFVRLWDPDQPNSDPTTFPGHEGEIWEIVETGSGLIASASADTTVRLWDPNSSTGNPVVLTGHREGVLELSILRDGRIASGSLDTTVRVWDPDRPEAEPIVFADHTTDVTKLAVLRDGRVAAGADDGSVLIWDPNSPDTEPIVLTGHTNSVSELAVLGDGRVISASADETVRIWDPNADR